jgi:hypothetical protein
VWWVGISVWWVGISVWWVGISVWWVGICTIACSWGPIVAASRYGATSKAESSLLEVESCLPGGFEVEQTERQCADGKLMVLEDHLIAGSCFLSHGMPRTTSYPWIGITLKQRLSEWPWKLKCIISVKYWTPWARKGCPFRLERGIGSFLI